VLVALKGTRNSWHVAGCRAASALCVARVRGCVEPQRPAHDRHPLRQEHYCARRLAPGRAIACRPFVAGEPQRYIQGDADDKRKVFDL
jgi:hypothetical protein